jgi:hypothetical protein
VLIVGTNPALDYPLPASGKTAPPPVSQNLLERFYFDYPKKPPHVRFANADDDEGLMAFLGDFGPVAVPFDLEHLRLEKASELRAREPLEALRREQRVFRALAEIIAVLSLKRPAAKAIESIASNVDTVATEWRNEPSESATREELHKWRTVMQYEFRDWTPIHFGHFTVAAALNRFPKRIQASRSQNGRWITEELPEVDTTGIRPTLYSMLRDDYLSRSIARCPERGCGQFFRITHKGKSYCSAQCARRFSSRRWWMKKGGRQRRERSTAGRRRGL